MVQEYEVALCHQELRPTCNLNELSGCLCPQGRGQVQLIQFQRYPSPIRSHKKISGFTKVTCYFQVLVTVLLRVQEVELSWILSRLLLLFLLLSTQKVQILSKIISRTNGSLTSIKTTSTYTRSLVQSPSEGILIDITF